jgi:hypothetical protein
LVENAVVADVSGDQKLLAFYTKPTRLNGGPYSGSLQVMTLPSGAPLSLAEDAFDANFNGPSETMYFFQQPALNPKKSNYAGTLWLWNPTLTAPVALSSGYASISATTADHAVTLFLDTPGPDSSVPGDVRLVRTQDCANASCVTTTVASGVVVLATRVSLDGRYAAYDTQTTDGTTTERDVFLVSVADATTTHVGAAMIPYGMQGLQRFSDLSPDGSLLATITAADGNGLALQVVSTTTGAGTPWSALPAGLSCTGVQFADATRLLVGTVDAQGGSAVYLTTATEASVLVNASQFFLEHSPPGAERYFFYSTTPVAALATGAPYDLQMLDLLSPSAPSVPLATASLSTPKLSDDLSRVWVTDHEDPSTGLGTLMIASLPAGPASIAASGAYASSANFAAGTDGFIYGDGEATAASVPNGVVGPLSILTGSGATLPIESDSLRWVSAPSPATIYVTADNPLRIYREATP